MLNGTAWNDTKAWIPYIPWIPWIPKTLTPLQFNERLEFLGLLISSERIIAADCRSETFGEIPFRPLFFFTDIGRRSPFQSSVA